MGYCIVYGACSSVGKTLLPLLLAAGRRQFILFERPEKASELECVIARNLTKAEQCLCCYADISDINGVMDSVNSTLPFDSCVDLMVYLIGTNQIAPAIETNIEDWDKIMNINLRGFYFASQLAAKNMILNGGGKIVSVASQHGVVVNDNRSVYCTSKAGLIHLSKQLAYEWAKYDIRVNVVSPTFILNDANREVLNTARNRRAYLDKIPLKRYATPDDIARAIMFLSSDNSSMITGQNIIVDGGWCLP